MGRQLRVVTVDRLALAAGSLVLAWLFYRQLMNGSLVVDHTRYFVLDDDMMVSMRFGRNLAEGHGLVWNPGGEHVEGYTNFLWTVLMAGVHLLPIADAHTAVPVKAISLALVIASLWLSLRLLRVFVPESRLAGILVVIGYVTCVDIVHWGAWGFETALLGFLQLVFLVCLLEQRRVALGWAALALIPLVRSDALAVFAVCAVAALIVSPDRRRTLVWTAAGLVPFAAHLVFRRIYYDDWLPNTYYLKLHLLDDRLGRGLDYVSEFLVGYGALLILSLLGAGVLWRRDRRAIALPLLVAGAVAYAATTGGDAFVESRFLAHAMPLVFVLAAAAVVALSTGRLVVVALAAVFVVVAISPWRSPSTLTSPHRNGDPPQQIATAALINKNADPGSRVAVMAAGIVPYLTRMETVDLLGKSDRHLARLRPVAGAAVGHGKIDPRYSVARRPDLIVSYRSIGYAASLAGADQHVNPIERFLASPAFRRDYLEHPIEERFLLERTAVFTRQGSREDADRRWTGIEVGG